ncbi:hypothetical protein PAECIP111891_00468 [Paenibacillus allorhizoplanae]|uniref:CBM6 domain-containing protein n=1 Tax=Paenibacillus allorhizoplanae TaxID=2905648 RepID=A0ABM9BRL0_9BACL|nr:glycosyl hydrolase family 98 C-terminal domain-containing protein [Paenibacillus allorhizoplanae]CAH1192967.1 hypothetical protein PAECIP111891_00468 [Paenibacillus allorhizoplanae]
MIRSLLAKILVLSFVFTSILSIGTSNQSQAATMRQVVDNTHPLYLIGYYYTDVGTVTQAWNSVPNNLKPYSAVVLIAEHHIDNTDLVKNWITARLNECQANGITCMVQAMNGETRESMAIPISWFETLMQTYSKLIGFNAAELYNSTGWFGEADGNHSQYVADLINMVSKYGGYFAWTDTNIFTTNGTVLDWIQNNSNLITAMRNHKDNFIFMYKESFTDNATDGLGLGLFLAGLAGNWGVSPDWWHWQLDGSGKVFGPASTNDPWKQIFSMPETMYGMDLVRTASEGATCFKFEGSWYSTSNNGRTTPAFDHLVVPLLNKLVDGSIHIPTRQEVLNKNKFAYIGKSAWSVPYMSDYADLYMKTGRYGIIPLLPTNVNATELANFENTSTTPKDEAYFQNLYPEETYSTNTFASRNGSTWYWMNSSENTDIYQSSKLIPKTNPSTYFYIGSNPHTYAVITEKTDKFKVHLNNYRVNKDSIYDGTAWDQDAINQYIYNTYSVNPNDDTLRTTRIRVNGKYNGQKPVLTITGDNGFTYTDQWNAATSEYTVTINHNGPVDLEIAANQAGSGQINPPMVIEAENGVLNGNAAVRSLSAASGGKYVGDLGGNASNYVALNTFVDNPGMYKMDISSITGESRSFKVSVNGRVAQQVTVNGTSWSQLAPVVSLYVNLDAGNNTIKFYNDTAWAPDLDKVLLTSSSSAPVTSVEGESGTVSGSAVVNNSSFSSGGKVVGNIGNHASNYVTLNANVSNAGIYRLNISGIVSGSRSFYISVNGGPGQRVVVNGTSWSALAPNAPLDVNLNAGNNALKLYNDNEYAPDLDRILLTP